MRYNSRLELDYKHTSVRKSVNKKYRIFVGTALISFLVLLPIGAYTIFTPEKIDIDNQVTSLSDHNHDDLMSNIETMPLVLLDQTQHTQQETQSIIFKKASKQASDDQQKTQQAASTPTTLANTLSNAIDIKKHTQTIKTGDNLSTIFTSLGLNTELHEILQLGEPVKELKAIYPHQKIHFYLQDDALIKLELETSLNRQLQIIQQHDTYVVSEVIRDFEIQTQSVHAVIENSLFLAGQRAGLSDAVIMQLANIFGWDIDFVFDIRKGDSFAVLFEERYIDGVRLDTGNILAASFTNRGKTYKAVRYTDSKGQTNYYTPDGLSMRKAFLRTPLDIFRISSGFNLRRKHPIHKKIKAHRGVDYAAPTGTPVYSSGDGRVLEAGYTKANGNYVFIQHGQTYITKYIHLHRKKVRTGQSVKQRQVIGTVGATGYATGPHLHYEFLVNGVNRNPRTVSLPKANPIPKAEKPRFNSMALALLEQLTANQQATQLANNR